MAETATLIEEQIGQHIASPQVLTSNLVNGKIQGKFKASNRVYNYVLTKKDLTYAPAGNMDSALFSALYLERYDAVAKRPKIGKSNCTYKSYQCGKICLGLRRKCRKAVNDVERVAKIFYLMEQDERTGKTLYNKAIGEVADGDHGKVVARAQKMRNSEERGAKAKQLIEERRTAKAESKAGFLNYGSGKPEDGKIKLVDYRNKDVNAYVAKLDGDGQRKFINDHGKTDPNSYKGKENVKEWDIGKLEDGVYEANTRKGIGVRGVEKAYFSVKSGKIDDYLDSYQSAKELLTPKEKRINKTSLSGSSDKQISYAESVRDKAIAKLQAKGLSIDDIQKAVSDPQTQTARWWLDNKDTAANKIYNAMTKRKA
jgi:DNA-binding CsgD family transcriptional regulator